MFSMHLLHDCYTLSYTVLSLFSPAYRRRSADQLDPLSSSSAGDRLPQDGGQLLPLPVLLLPHQPPEPESHVRPPELPAGEQQCGVR